MLIRWAVVVQGKEMVVVTSAIKYENEDAPAGG
jgi:hypothetical protein